MEKGFIQLAPLFKKGCPLTASNYRLIFRLSMFGTVIEKVMYKHLNDCLALPNILYNF